MTEFIVMNRLMVESGSLDQIYKKFALISIFSPEIGAPKIPENNKLQAILQVECHDVDYDEDGNITARRGFVEFKDQDIVPFADDMARDIVEFAKKYAQYPIIVHCDAGLSRSPAAALALSKIINNGERMPEMWVRSLVGGMRLYNRYIYRKILNAEEPL